MSRKSSLIALGLVVAIAGSGISGGFAKAADAKPVVQSANDPTRPVPGGVRWFGRVHAACVERTRKKDFDVCFLGDSITAMWPGDLFDKNFGKHRPANFGLGGDRTENVLWRLENGELVGTSPKLIVLLIGTNNSGFNTPEEITLGVSAVVKKLRSMLPDTKILLQGILPRKDANRAKTDAANPLIAKLADGDKVQYHDFGKLLLTKEGRIADGMLSDDVHLTRKGYEAWAEALTPMVAKIMGKK